MSSRSDLRFIYHRFESTEKSKAEIKADKEKAAKMDDPRAGADTGKIVNLMAGDANRVTRDF